MEEANIIPNRNLLPGGIREDRHYENPGGIRIGASEIICLGMGEEEMEEIADLGARVVVEEESPREVSGDVANFSKDYTDVHYCFDSEVEAYEYIDTFSEQFRKIRFPYFWD